MAKSKRQKVSHRKPNMKNRRKLHKIIANTVETLRKYKSM
jgi:hypothetical protein